MNFNEDFHKVLFTTLLSNMPTDTLNMMTQTNLLQTRDVGTHWKITITGPMATNPKNQGRNLNYDYAYDVNYNQQRGVKEIRNYKYVERNIQQVAHLFGMGVTFL